MALKWLRLGGKKASAYAPERTPFPADHGLSSIEDEVLHRVNAQGESAIIKPDEFRATHTAICTGGFLPEAEQILYALKGKTDEGGTAWGIKAMLLFAWHRAEPDHLREDFDALGPLAKNAMTHIGEEKHLRPLVAKLNDRFDRAKRFHKIE